MEEKSQVSGSVEVDNDLVSSMPVDYEDLDRDRRPGIISTVGVRAGNNAQQEIRIRKVGSAIDVASGSTLNPSASQIRDFVEELDEAQRTQVNGDTGAVGNVGVGGDLTGALESAEIVTPRMREKCSLNALLGLISQFQQGLCYPHHTWLGPMREICIKCWDLAHGDCEFTALVNYAGFLILPGLILATRTIKGSKRPVDFLIRTSKMDFPGMEIVRKAFVVQSELEVERQRRRNQ